MTARISVRVPVAPDLAKGRATEAVCPAVAVKELALPMVAPLAFRKLTVPVHDAAAPPEEFEAVLVRFTCRVSELARPVGGKVDSRVTVLVVVCASAEAASAAPPSMVKRNCRMDMVAFLLLCLDIRQRSSGCLVLRTAASAGSFPVL